jgi:hypothetical protein
VENIVYSPVAPSGSVLSKHYTDIVRQRRNPEESVSEMPR